MFDQERDNPIKYMTKITFGHDNVFYDFAIFWQFFGEWLARKTCVDISVSHKKEDEN